MNMMKEVLSQCDNILPGHGAPQSMQLLFQELADGLTGDEMADSYGQGDYLAEFEAEIAEMFGKESAVFLPSGTMAQQIACRIWCERSHNFTIAMHPTAHLETAEHAGHQFLQGIQRLQFGAPEAVQHRLLQRADFEQLGVKPGVILLELPHRPLGGQLPTWEELLAICDWAKEQNIRLHLDGARIWSCLSFYQKSFAEIAALFDSVYVSFYKDLGGLCGAMLIGSTPFIQEAKVWQRRYGGNLKTMAPFIVSARSGLATALPQIEQWVDRTRQIADILSQFEQIRVNPNPPHVNFFQLYIQGDAQELTDKHLALARETGTFLFYNLHSLQVPGVAMTEIHCWQNALSFDTSQLPAFLTRLLA